MHDNHDRSHPAGISRRNALLGVLGLAAIPCLAEGKETISQTKTATAFVPENNYPTFADEPDSQSGSAQRLGIIACSTAAGAGASIRFITAPSNSTGCPASASPRTSASMG